MEEKFMEFRMFFALFTGALHLSLSWVIWIQSVASQPISMQYYPPIYAKVSQVVALYIPPSNGTVYAPLLSVPYITTCSTNHIFLYLTTQMTFGEEGVKKFTKLAWTCGASFLDVISCVHKYVLLRLFLLLLLPTFSLTTMSDSEFLRMFFLLYNIFVPIWCYYFLLIL